MDKIRTSLIGVTVAAIVALAAFPTVSAALQSAAPPASCLRNQLGVRANGIDGAAGTIHGSWVFTNFSAKACDLDGYPDILTANGHIEEEIGRVQPKIHYKEPPLLFRNLGAKKFENVSTKVGDQFSVPMVARVDPARVQHDAQRGASRLALALEVGRRGLQSMVDVDRDHRLVPSPSYTGFARQS